MRSYLKAVIFDLDGTLADTIPAITEAVNMTMRKLGFPERTEHEIRSFIGRGPRHLISQSLPYGVILKNPHILDKALSIYDDMYEKTYLHTTSLYDGLEEVIITLSKYYKIAVLSNKQDRYVKELVKQLLPEGVCQIARGSINGVPVKPDPAVALQIAKELEVNPHECILVGDSDIDILTAENAEFDILSVSWGYVNKMRLAYRGVLDIADDPNELLEYFK